MTYSKSSDCYEESKVYEDSYEDFIKEVEWMKRNAAPLPVNCINALTMPDKRQETLHESKIQKKDDDDEPQKSIVAMLDEADKHCEKIFSEWKLKTPASPIEPAMRPL